LVIGCSAKVTHIDTDPSYTPAHLAARAVAILGCTSIADEVPDDIRRSTQLSPRLQAALHKELEGIDIVEWGEVRRMLGDRMVRRYLDEVLDFATIGPAVLDSLGVALRNVSRYAIVHRIESDKVEFDEDETGKHEDDEWVKTGYELKTKRIISATFSVYDLDEGKRVWTATIEGNWVARKQISAEEAKRLDVGGGWFGKVVDTIYVLDDVFGEDDEKPNPFPPPPTEATVMERLYGKFAEEVAKER
jgi:hypothetical protein